MKTNVIAYVATFLVFMAIDFIWLTAMANRLYKPYLGDIMADDFRPLPAVLFYLLFVLGLVFFAVRPAIASGDWKTALLQGAAFGFFCYATYDLTNQATLRTWSSVITIADMIWGTVLSGVAAAIGFRITRYFTSG
jgi:uncharacterized membrane protein